MATNRISLDTTVIWPEREDETDYEYEHAIAVHKYGDGGVTLYQKDSSVLVPRYALKELIAVLRKIEKESA